MIPQPRTPEETYGPALEKAVRDLAGLDPVQAAARAGARYEATDAGGRLSLPWLGALCEVDWPEGTAQRSDGELLDVSSRLVVLHYLLTADGTPLTGRWIAFRNLPGGLGYDAAFQGRASLRLAQAFGRDRAAFVAACRSLAGEPLAFGDAAFGFRALPCLWLAAVLNLADDEFPASANVLFDASAQHYLPTEDLAVLGGILAGRLIKAGRSR